MGNPHSRGACQGVTCLAVPNLFRRILMSKLYRLFSTLSGAILLSPLYASAQEVVATGAADALRNVEQYNFSIHIMAMLLLGFGFLMVFVKKYGYSATTGTYLVVGAGIPLYMLLRSFGTISSEPVAADNVHALLLAEFGCAVVPSGQMQHTVINTILALCGATLMTYIASSIYRKGKVAIADIANASLAGGVAVGATCNVLNPASAFLAGLIAGFVCVTGYVVIQPVLQKLLRSVDTCGVRNLHGMPGLVGGVAAVLVVPGVAKAQLLGIAFTVIFAFVSGCIGGYVLRFTGRKATIYEDKAFIGVE